MTVTPNRFSFLVGLVLALAACGAPEETPYSLELGEPFVARVTDSVPLQASTEGIDRAEAIFHWRVAASDAPGTTVEVATSGLAALSVDGEGTVAVEAVAAEGGREVRDTISVTFDSEHELSLGARLSPAPYTQPQVRTVTLTGTDGESLGERPVAVFGDVVAFGDLLVGRLDGDGTLAAQSTYRESGLFPSRVIPYAFTPLVFSDDERTFIENLVTQIGADTVLEFERVPITSTRTAILFSRNEQFPLLSSGCWAEKNPLVYANRRVVNLGSGFGSWNCMSSRTIRHEVLHAIGLFHEHQRIDRDEHVDARAVGFLGTADPGWILNFQQPAQNVDHGEYDWASIMHYPFTTYEHLAGAYATMEARDDEMIPDLDYEVGEGSMLSPGDIAAIDALYGVRNAVAVADDFDDHDFTADPSWTLQNDDDIPGTVSANDGYLRFLRTNAGGNGGAVGVDMLVDIPVTAETIVTFDAIATYRSVGAGCGWTCREYPANIDLHLVDAAGTTHRVRYAVNYGTELEDQVDGTYHQLVTQVEQDTWTRDLRFTIRDTVPNATTITRIHLYGNGWNFDGGIDNLAIASNP